MAKMPTGDGKQQFKTHSKRSVFSLEAATFKIRNAGVKGGKWLSPIFSKAWAFISLRRFVSFNLLLYSSLVLELINVVHVELNVLQ